MAEKGLPEWTTELDKEILELLNTELVLTPTVIAENIDRSRGAVTRRLNTLEAGGLVQKMSRGKYKITGEALDMFEGGWKQFKVSEEESRQLAKEDYERRKRIEERTGLSEREYLKEVQQEYERLKSESEEPSDDLFSKAFEIVDKKYREG